MLKNTAFIFVSLHVIFTRVNMDLSQLKEVGFEDEVSCYLDLNKNEKWLVLFQQT